MICQLTGVSVPLAFNALAVAVAVLAWLPGLAWLTRVLAGPRLAQTATPAVLLLGSAFGFLPYALLIWGVLYPTYLAYVIFPSGLALNVLLAQRWFPRLFPTDADAPISAGPRRWTLLALAAAGG